MNKDKLNKVKVDYSDKDFLLKLKSIILDKINYMN
jgi:hypothetical protein